MSSATATTRGGLRAVSTALLVLLLSSSLAACASIPVSGPVREGLDSFDRYESVIVFNPSGPLPGASPEDIVRGFAQAASSSAGDYEIAREFLTSSYADDWDPWAGVSVDEGTQQFSQSENGTATLGLRLVATVDGGGRLAPVRPGPSTNFQFELVQQHGEWRISSAPNGIILDKDTFNTAWTPRSVYFLSGDGRLVPEARWFLNRPTLSTQIVRELLSGPADTSTSAVHTAFPQGTTLLSEAVPVSNGTAVIDLSEELFEADPESMELLKRQLAASLQGVQSVQRFALLVNGAEVDEVSVSSADDPAATESQYMMVLKNGEFGVAVADTVRPVEGLSERVVELAPMAVTVAPDRTAAAVLHPGGVSWVGAADTVAVDTRSGLLVPSLDALGYVWVTDPSTPGVITVSMPGEESVVLAMPWPEGRRVVAARVSMGGSRLAVLVEDQGDSAVLVAGIRRDERGAPVGLTETASTQLWVSGTPVDLDWIDDGRFVLLTETGLLGTSRRITIGNVGQFPVDAGAISGGVSISGGGSRALTRVLDDQHRLFQPQGSGWQLQQSDVELLAKVG